MTHPDQVDDGSIIEYALRHPKGFVMDPSYHRKTTEERLARYRDTVPGFELVTRATLAGEWVTIDQVPALPAVPPRRGDAIEAWLKAQRDRFDRHGDSSEFWHEFDTILDEYRLHADTGTPLGQHACENGNADDCHGCYQEAQQ
ncbi:hypothetical protein KCMC57_64230 (plasmid) [Kitasatospora sp. CMC57]|uniref:Uncharacterized protein n=1 Tax=Kitasatospora sp. CMC57 TaxID=3231513 RepID=A0AB33KB87_9ACTN